MYLFLDKHVSFMKNSLISFIELLDTYKKGYDGLHIPPDDCELLADKLKEVVKKYNIPND